ncbi:MAG TPA: endolytic transglycosylase MltG, partial [Telluria sp.]|nr:endolytic transglycosylase MltG [Telluria sp.]
MALIKKLLFVAILLLAVAGTGFGYWAKQPITTAEPAIEFSIAPGSHGASISQQMAAAGVPVNPTLFTLLARITQKSSRIKAGSYELKPFTTPLRLLDQLVRGEFAQESLTIIEGWTFKQMRAAVAAAASLKHDSVNLSDQELLTRVTPGFKHPEGLFFPDTYLFAKHSSDFDVYRTAHQQMLKHLNAAWEKRDPNLPYTNPYEALIMASIVEKETGQKSERAMIAGVFVNRLKLGMLLQTDPTVIYG